VVGLAETIHPLPLVIPCQRSIGAGGGLHGFGAGEGLAIKTWSLQIESTN